ncbi:MAG: ABC transporter permease [Cyclobacteriaceae bacterium]|nr:ABC transporter permease [Cyclobacteriaceae bacterium]MCB0498110.1 ABC transporter permease [Cyclobacteriaceae bacterium]MCB9238834.1 ABC transporter permease [Flammeovirgaceae bacterium]MCW5901006.1 ABC transporter permease [Cyclobacteriaceae bacterium]
MISNYLKVAIRNIFRNRLTAFINIVGLALAMACALLIYLYIMDELSYDKYNSKIDRIYRVTRDFKSPDGSVNLHLGNVAPPIGPLMKNDFGEIEAMARTNGFNLVIGLEENGELVKNFTERNLFVAEPAIFKIFDIKVTAGNPETALNRPFTVMLSEKTAKKYFGDEPNIIGKRLRANNAFDIEVTGTFEDFPLQAHWHPELLVSFSTMENDNIYGRQALETNWGNNAFGTYLLLDEGYDPKKLEAQLPAFLDKHFGTYAIANYGAPPDFVASKRTSLYLQKVSDIHLYSHLDDELEVNGNINNVYMMGVIGLFIILIAGFNFINLSTARATKRAKEVGLRKVVGAIRGQLITQYLSESVLITLLAMVLSLAFAFMGLEWLNSFTQKELALHLFQQPLLLAGLITASVAIGLLAGIYPAFIVSGYRPALTLKGQQGSARGKGAIRKVLVVSQFSISVALLIATAITIQQLSYLNSKDLGFDKDQVVTLSYFSELQPNYDAFYNELMRSSGIKNAGRSSRIPTGRLLDSQGAPRIAMGDSLVNTEITTKNVRVDESFFPTYNIPFVAGRNFSKSIGTDDSLAFIVNETAAKAYGLATPEEGINRDFSYGGVTGKLIGVVKDFHFESLHQGIIPIVFHQGGFNTISVKIAGNNLQEGLQQIEKVWREFLPNRPFEYQFLDQRYQQLYEAEQDQSHLFTIFSGLAIFIACLGLFGLATFNTLQRVKEIGIRKVLGASVASILRLLSKEIVVLILVANLIAWPVAWYFMNKWLDTFAYHVDMGLLVYLLAGAVAVLVALVTVSSQTIKAAMTNPSNTLRYE